MKYILERFIPRYRNALLGGLLVAALAGLSVSAFSEGKTKTPNPPPKFKVDTSEISRDETVIPSYAPVVRRISPSVVNIFTTKNGQRIEVPAMPPSLDPFFRRFFDDLPGDRNSRRSYRTPKQQGLGSGVIVTEDGYILTNNHVVDGADEIKVGLNSGKAEYDARVVGKDPKTDIAVLKIDASDLPCAELGDSDYLEVGDVVLALGNPFGLGQTVTSGIISAKGRATLGLDYEDFIQTDAAINPGNSGGALADGRGRLIGINTAILSRSGGNQGIGFAVPINLARSVMESLIRDGRVVRGFLGVTIQNVTPELAAVFELDESAGALVSEVMPETPAARAGLKSGDIILSLDEKDVRDSRQLKLAIGHAAPGKAVTLRILRDGEQRDVSVELKEMPGTALAGGTISNEENESERLKGVMVGDLDQAARAELDLPRQLEGVLVRDVDPESAAFEAGLRRGDIIQEIDKTRVRTAEQAVSLSRQSDDPVTLLRIWRDGASRFLVVDES